MKKNFCILAIFALALLVPGQGAAGDPLSQRLSGKILLQVEQAGEAWYVSPADGLRYYLGRPDDAFSIMRELGVGITDMDLSKIPPFESPAEPTDFSIKHAGKIFLQVQQDGQAWYVYPGNFKRYYLGRPADAFEVMRSLGLGITDTDLAKIPAETVVSDTGAIIRTGAGDEHAIDIATLADLLNYNDFFARALEGYECVNLVVETGTKSMKLIANLNDDGTVSEVLDGSSAAAGFTVSMSLEDVGEVIEKYDSLTATDILGFVSGFEISPASAMAKILSRLAI